MELPGFYYADSAQITREVAHQSHKAHVYDESIDVKVKRGVNVIWQKSPYAVDALCRHSQALQNTKIGQLHCASMNKATAKKLEINASDDYLGVPVVITESVANNCVFINANRATGGQS